MAQSEKKRESRGYKVVLTGIKGILRLLVIACLLVVLFYLGRRSYALGREAFTEKPVDIGGGRTIVVTITDDMSTYQIGKMLRAEGLLTESAMAFWLQELMSEYHGELRPGTYALKTSMTTQEMFPILAQADKEEAGDDSFIAPGMQLNTTSAEQTSEESGSEVTETSSSGAEENTVQEVAASEVQEAAPEAADAGDAAADGENAEEASAQEEANAE
ncbi:MAG: endolytic transglycosylase MltG [Eubacterium sp.]|nr:endolytic transglycosylase MltG [Eubacterium sp.]